MVMMAVEEEEQQEAGEGTERELKAESNTEATAHHTPQAFLLFVEEPLLEGLCLEELSGCRLILRRL